MAALSSRPLSAADLISALGLTSKTGSFKRVIKALLDSAHIEYTTPDKPQSRLQKYRLTEKGRTIWKK